MSVYSTCLKNHRKKNKTREMRRQKDQNKKKQNKRHIAWEARRRVCGRMREDAIHNSCSLVRYSSQEI
jgi:hypothetical protein